MSNEEKICKIQVPANAAAVLVKYSGDILGITFEPRQTTISKETVGKEPLIITEEENLRKKIKELHEKAPMQLEVYKELIEGNVFTFRDLKNELNQVSLSVHLGALVNKGLIRRVTRGVYKVPDEVREIAKKIIKEIIPHADQ